MFQWTYRNCPPPFGSFGKALPRQHVLRAVAHTFLKLKSPAGAAASLPFVLRKAANFFAGVGPSFQFSPRQRKHACRPLPHKLPAFAMASFFCQVLSWKKVAYKYIFPPGFWQRFLREFVPRMLAGGRLPAPGKDSTARPGRRRGGENVYILFLQRIRIWFFGARHHTFYPKCSRCSTWSLSATIPARPHKMCKLPPPWYLNTLIYYSRQLQNKKTWLKFFRASTSRNGTCLTSTECTDRSGTIAGNCAAGHGPISLHL